MKFSENVDRGENGEIRGNVDPVNNVMLSTMPGVLEKSAKKLQSTIKRLENPNPLGEPYERNEASNTLHEVDRVLDIAIQIAKNESSDNVMLSFVPGMFESSKKKLKGVIRCLDIPRSLDEPYERNEASNTLHEVDRILGIAIRIVKNEPGENAIEGRQALAIEMLG